MRKQRLAITAASAFLVLAIPTALLATGRTAGEAHYRPTTEAFKYRMDPVSTASNEFEPVPGLDDLAVTNRGPVSVIVSGDFSGAPVDVRVTESQKRLPPGIAHFDPSVGSSSFSFTFVRERHNKARCRRFDVEWRSSSGQDVTLNHGTVLLRYKFDNTTKDRLRVACA